MKRSYVCPICESAGVRVVDSRRRPDPDGGSIVQRTRECERCLSRWRTHETLVHMIRIEGDSTRAAQLRDRTLRSNLPRLQSGDTAARDESVRATQGGIG